MKTIAVITCDYDAHVPYVQRHLDDQMVAITSEAIVARQELSFHIDGSKTEVILDGSPLRNVSAVWFRKPNNFERVDVPVHKTFDKYARSSLDNHFRQLRAQFGAAKWISDYYAIARAEHKTLQLPIAARVGFRVPETLFTSNAEAAKAFLSKYPAIITKTMAGAFPSDDLQSYYFFARKITKEHQDTIRNLHLCPAIFQQAIDVAADLRVTVVGDKIFSARVVTEDDTTSRKHPIRDWRHDYHYDKVHFDKYELPDDIKEACFRLVKELGLRFGAIDLVSDKKGRIWFLEINPNGQWAFVEDDTGLPIGKAIAQLLTQ